MRILVIALSLLLTSCQSHKISTTESVLAESHHPNEVPLNHSSLTISYNPEHRLPNWVSYKLDLNRVNADSTIPKNKFYADPLAVSLRLPQAKPKDLSNSGYDWVQTAPSADFLGSKDAYKQTFMMTNLVPMKRNLSRGASNKLESKIRKWACTEKVLTVISGPILNADLKKFKSGVSIPKKFFKIVIDESAPRKAIAFIFDQEDRKKDFKDAATNVQDVEMQTGFDFINSPNGAERKYLRTKFNLSDWNDSGCR